LGREHDEIEAVLRSWSTRITSVSVERFGFARGLKGRAQRVLCHAPVLKNMTPNIVHVKTAVA